MANAENTHDRQSIEDKADRVWVLAQAWRKAVEVTDRTSDPILADFPKGACGDSRLLLARFLDQHGMGRPDYILGRTRASHYGLPTHAWLELEDVLIDITADQFGEDPGPPVVVTRSRAWFARFEPYDRRVPCPRLEEYDDRAATRLIDMYERILQNVPPHIRPCSSSQPTV